MKLRPLIVLTGTLRVEGGSRDEKRVTRGERDKDHAKVTTSIVRDITDDRRKGDSLCTGYIRRLGAFRLLKTPFGILVDTAKLGALKEMLAAVTRDAQEFNATAKTTRLTNCYLWEPLFGQRKEAIEHWLDERIAAGDPVVLKARPRIEAAPAASAALAPVPAPPAPPAPADKV